MVKKYQGIDEISIRMSGRSYNTLIAYKRDTNFPMFKVMGHWQAYEEDIAKWEEFQDNGVFFEDSDIPTRKKQKKPRKSAKKTTKNE